MIWKNTAAVGCSVMKIVLVRYSPSRIYKGQHAENVEPPAAGLFLDATQGEEVADKGLKDELLEDVERTSMSDTFIKNRLTILKVKNR